MDKKPVLENVRKFNFLTPQLLINGISLLVAVLVIYLSIDNYIQDREERKNKIGRQLGSMVELTVDDIARGLNGARESLRLISRMSVMRETRPAGSLTKKMDFAQPYCNAVIDLIETISKILVISAAKVHEKAISEVDWGKAAIRRGFWTLGMAVEPELPENPTFSAPGRALQGEISPFGDEFFAWLRDTVGQLLAVASDSGKIIDLCWSFGEGNEFNVEEARLLLKASLSDKDLIRSLTVKRLDGTDLVSVTEIGDPLGFPGQWVQFAEKGSKPFFPGPVWFDEGLGRPMWQVATPLRDLERKVHAVLTSQIDLGFLSELIGKAKITPSSYMFIVDEDGTVISHPKISVVANQVNVSKVNPAVADVLEGQDGFREVEVGGVAFYAAYGHLKKLDPSNLPGWGILFMIPVSDVFSGFWTVINSIVWVIFCLYLLFGVNDLILTAFEGDGV